MKNILTLIVVAILMISCGNEQETLKGKIDGLETELFGETTNYEVDDSAASLLISYYAEYAEKFPTSENAADYLYKAGEVSRAIKDYNASILYWNKVYMNHKDFEKMPHSVFLQGFVYENDIKDFDLAKVKYAQFLKEFPDHELADDVEFSLNFLGKSPEEIIRQFEEKNDSTKTEEGSAE